MAAQPTKPNRQQSPPPSSPKPLDPLLKSNDPDLAKFARNPALMVRETPGAQVEKAAGGRSAEVIALGDHAGIPVSKTTHPEEPFFRPKSSPSSKRHARVDCHVNHTLFNARWQTAATRRRPKGSPEYNTILKRIQGGNPEPVK